MLPSFEAINQSSVNEAPQDRWIIGGDSLMQLDWELHVYACTHEFISRPTDDPSSRSFSGTLEKAFRIDRSIIGAEHIGEAITIGLGEIQVANSEGDYDNLAVDFSPQGQRVTIKMGNRRRPYTEWRTVLHGWLSGMDIDRATLTFRMRDAGWQLDVPASPNVYAGTGDTEGTADLTGKRKPRFFGYNLNVSPPLVIPNYLTFQLNDGPIQSVSAVYVRGVELLNGGNWGTVADLNATPLSIGYYGTCLNAGFMRVAVASDEELGDITCDFAGDKTDGIFVSTTADIVRRLLVTEGTGLVDPDDLITTSFDTLNTAQPAPVGWGIEAGSEETVATVIAKLMSCIGGWCGARRTGEFEVSRFEAPSGTSVATYTRNNIRDVKIIPLPSGFSPPPWRVRIGYQYNWTIQTNLAGSVSDTRRAFLEQQVRYQSAENPETKIDFPPGHELVKDDCNFRDYSDALFEAARLLNIYGTARALYVFQLCEPLFVHELGQLITLDFPRFDLNGGKLLRICKLTEDDEEGVEIVAFG